LWHTGSPVDGLMVRNYNSVKVYDMIYDTIYLLTAIGLSTGGRSTVHIYTQTIQNDTKQTIHRTTQ